MDTVYLCFLRLFGFGLPYMMCTRTPLEDNICFVGVPPVDVLAALLKSVPGKGNRVERERARIMEILERPGGVEAEMERRIACG